MCNRPLGWWDKRNLSSLAKSVNIRHHYKTNFNIYDNYQRKICKSFEKDFNNPNIEIEMIHILLKDTLSIWIKTRDHKLSLLIQEERLNNKLNFTYEEILPLYSVAVLSGISNFDDFKY